MQKYYLLDKLNQDKLLANIDDYPHGIVINVNKPYIWTSSDVVRKLKFKFQKHFNKKNIKVGHAGTLDPLANGVLMVCIGKATKIAEELQSHQKEYIAEICFGATTPSFDLETEIDNKYPFEHINILSIQDALSNFIGEQDQVPPVFSAKMINGKRAYEMAREGKEVEMRSAKIHIYDLTILDYNSPKLLIKIRCSKGTYIRSFARDLALALNSGGHLSNLTRSASGDFKHENALSIEEIESVLTLPL